MKDYILIGSTLFFLLVACNNKSNKDYSKESIANNDSISKEIKIKSDPLCFKIEGKHLGYDSLFFKACIIGDFNKVKQFIEKGIDLNKKDSFGNTALMYAVAQPMETGNFKIVKLLVESGAELNHVNSNGKTVLTIARTYFNNNGHSHKDNLNLCEISRYLKENGAIEQDYIDFIAGNLSGNKSIEQEIVLSIKQYYKDFDESKENLIVRKLYLDSDNPNEVTHIAYYSNTNQLEYFYFKDHYELHYHDGDINNIRTKNYYFKHGRLYFYFEDFENFIPEERKQIRAYYSKDSLIIAAIKELNYCELYQTKIDIQTLVNVQEMSSLYSHQNIMNKFDEDYKSVKDSLLLKN